MRGHGHLLVTFESQVSLEGEAICIISRHALQGAMSCAIQKPTSASRHQAEICWAERLLWLCAAAPSAHLQLLEWSCQIPETLHNA